MYVPRATYSLRMSFWIVPPSCRARDALLLGDHDVHRQQRRRRRVDRHRRGDRVERDPVEQRAACPRRCRSPRRRARPRRARAASRSRSPSASGGRTRPRGRSARRRAASGSARSSRRRCRSRRTGASSTAARGTSSRCTPRVNGNCPGSPSARPPRSAGRTGARVRYDGARSGCRSGECDAPRRSAVTSREHRRGRSRTSSLLPMKSGERWCSSSGTMSRMPPCAVDRRAAGLLAR